MASGQIKIGPAAVIFNSGVSPRQAEHDARCRLRPARIPSRAKRYVAEARQTPIYYSRLGADHQYISRFRPRSDEPYRLPAQR